MSSMPVQPASPTMSSKRSAHRTTRAVPEPYATAAPVIRAAPRLAKRPGCRAGRRDRKIRHEGFCRTGRRHRLLSRCSRRSIRVSTSCRLRAANRRFRRHMGGVRGGRGGWKKKRGGGIKWGASSCQHYVCRAADSILTAFSPHLDCGLHRSVGISSCSATAVSKNCV